MTELKATYKPRGLTLVRYRINLKQLLRKIGFDFKANTPTAVLEQMVAWIDKYGCDTDADREEFLQYKREIMEMDEQSECDDAYTKEDD